MQGTKSCTPLSRVGLLIASFGVVLSGYSQPSLTSSLAGYYPFNGNANDASGNGNNGKVFGAALTSDRFEQAASAYSFGQSEYIACDNAPQLNFGPGASFSVFAWIKFSGNVPGFQGIVSKMYNDSNPTSGFQFGIFQNTVQVQMGSPPALTFNGSLTLNDGKWHFVGLQRENSIAELIIDGRLEAAVSNPMLVPQDMTCTNSLLIGVDRNLSRFFPGSIDDLRIYNRALTQTEWQQLYVSESAPLVNFVRAFTVDYSNLIIGSNYQLQASADMNGWTNFGTAFTATSVNYTNTNFQRISDWNRLFFRLVTAP